MLSCTVGCSQFYLTRTVKNPMELEIQELKIKVKLLAEQLPMQSQFIWYPVTTFQNGWSNYEQGWPGAAYSKVGNRVFLKGLVKGGIAGQVIFNLPLGLRPTGNCLFPVDGHNQHARVDVYPTGNVHHVIGALAYVTLDPINFSIS